MIASSNIPIPDVNEVGVTLGNKSSPGNIGSRYFNGDQVIDKMEELCHERALEAFDLDPKEWHVNVQTLSGSLANLCLFHGVLKPGDTILALDTKHSGGHHTHGLKSGETGLNIYTQAWIFEHYEVNRESRIDFEVVRQAALDVKPKLIIAGASTYPRDQNYRKFREIADEVGAYLMADIAHGIGLVISGVNNDPFPYADFVTASSSKTMRGPRGGLIYSKKEFADAIDKAVFPGILGAPQNSLIPGLAVAFKYCQTPHYRYYAEKCVANAKALCEALDFYGYRVVTGGTDTNIMLYDTTHTGVNARTMLDIAEEVNIIFNGASLPTDPENFGQGGVRLGTNVITSRGYLPEDCWEVAKFMNEINKIGMSLEGRTLDLSDGSFESRSTMQLAKEVEKFALSFPLPGVTTRSVI